MFDEARRSSWSILKSSVFALVKPLIAIMSYCNGVLSISSEFAVNATLEAQAAKTEAQFASNNVSFKDSCISCPAMIAHEHAMIAQTDNAGSYRLEWVADSGAGKDLASIEALVEQGVPSSIVQSCAQADEPIKFETGNGVTVSDTRVECSGSRFGKSSFCILDSCPVVRSLGALVSSGRPFVWIPGQLPFLGDSIEDVQISANKDRIQLADRVEDNVPIFVEEVQFDSSSFPGFAPFLM